MIIQPDTTIKPITTIGRYAGVCYGANVQDEMKNFKRGLDCLEHEHGRTFEFVDVYLVLDGYSARVMREWYTHIGGAPTRLQASTRYINYEDFRYVTPPAIQNNEEAARVYQWGMGAVQAALKELDKLAIKREDAAMLLPLGMETRVVCKHNLRNLIDMSHQRLCSRAYREYRELMRDLMNALRSYSLEWEWIVENYFKPKCMLSGTCPEQHGCGLCPPRDQPDTPKTTWLDRYDETLPKEKESTI